MKRILFIDYACNCVELARHVARESNGAMTIYVMSELADPVTWGYQGMTFISERWSVDKIVAFAKVETLDLVVNFSSPLGSAGLLEALRASQISCIGSDRAFSQLEIDKQYFKNWLAEQGFRTPTIYYQGLYEHVVQRLDTFTYPLVIKPDIQAGPQVKICHSEEDVCTYFDATFKKIPQARYGVLFLLEEYIPTRDVIGVQYYLMSGKGYLSDTMQFLFEEKTDANLDGGVFAITPYHQLSDYRDEIQRLLDVLATFGDKAIGHLQYLVDKKGNLYVIENNSRPATYSFMNRDDVLGFLEAMASGDVEKLERQFMRLWGKEHCAFGVALLHAQDYISVNVDRLSHLSDTEYYPFSIVTQDGQSSSSHRKIPSLMVFHGETYVQAIDHAKAAWMHIAECGNFNPINLSHINHWLMH